MMSRYLYRVLVFLYIIIFLVSLSFPLLFLANFVFLYEDGMLVGLVKSMIPFPFYLDHTTPS